MNYDYIMTYINLFIFIFISLITVGLGIVVYKNKKSLTNRLFFWFTISFLAWSLFNFLETWIKDPVLAKLFLKLDFASAPIMAYFVSLFLLNFPHVNEKINNFSKRFFFFIPIFLISLLSITNWVIKDVNIGSDKINFNFEIGYYPYTLIILLYFIFGILNLIKQHKQSSLSEKLQINYILIGFFSTFALLIIFNLVLQNYISSDLFRIGNYSPLILIAFTTYAIIVHRLMDVKMVMRRSSVYLATLASIVIPAFFIEHAFSAIFDGYSIWSEVFILTVAISIFPPIKNYYYRFANKYLFSSLYDSKKVIAELSEKLRSILEVEKIYTLISEILTDSFHSKAIGVLLFNKKRKNYTLRHNSGFNIGKLKTIKNNQEIYDLYLSANKIIILEELKNSSYDRYKEYIDEMAGYNIEILVPLNIKNRNLGILVLGPKEAGDMYNDEDLGVLKIVSAQMAIALENALLYEETRSFNKKLKQEIEIATTDLLSANEKLKKLDVAKSEFISIASHQLRTPLTAIKGYISMMIEGDFGELTPVEKEALEKVFNSNERLIKLVENLLNVSRIESGRLQFNFEEVQLETMVESVMDELSNYAKKKDLTLEYKKPETPLPKVNIDDEKIRQVVMNLIDNAIKYTKQGTVTVSLAQVENNLEFRVSDSGMGISPTDLPNLFQKFSRGTGASLTHTEGTGLGLYVARQMIEAHQGKIWAESKGEAMGSQFCFKLPIIQHIINAAQ